MRAATTAAMTGLSFAVLAVSINLAVERAKENLGAADSSALDQTEETEVAPEPPQDYTGDLVTTHHGAVQVKITVQEGTIIASDAIEYPKRNPKEEEINLAAIPVLNAAAISAQSAEIDLVSGATDTSKGYRTSLQSAVDRANLGTKASTNPEGADQP